jgi:hypothetical protein
MSVKLHATAVWPVVKKHTGPIEYGVKWSPEPVFAVWRTEKSLSPAGIPNSLSLAQPVSLLAHRLRYRGTPLMKIPWLNTETSLPMSLLSWSTLFAMVNCFHYFIERTESLFEEGMFLISHTSLSDISSTMLFVTTQHFGIWPWHVLR